MSVLVLGVLGTGLVDPLLPVVRADDPGIERGDGCFEGCRIRTAVDGTSRVDKLDRHLARMSRSATALGISLDEVAWRALVDEALAACTTPGEYNLKLLLSRGSDGRPAGLLTVRPLPGDYPRQRRDGLVVITLPRGTASDTFTDAPWLLGGVKTLSYAINMAAQREAERHGADDALYVSSDGYVLEAPTASAVWAVGRTLYTTPLDGTGILGGTTQQLLFERAADAGWRLGEALVTVGQLQAADSVWLVSSVRGPVDVVSLDGVPRSRDPRRNAEIAALAGF